MNTPNWSKNTTRFGEHLFRLRGYTPLPFVILFIFKAHPSTLAFAAGLIPVIMGELLRFWGVAYAGAATRSRVISGRRLVTGGPYSYVRNPLYLGNILIYSGMAVIANIWMPYLLLATWGIFFWQYHCIVAEEEKVLEDSFGETYRNYKRSTPRFLPRPARPSAVAPDRPDYRMALRSEKSTLISLAAILLMLLMRAVWFSAP